MNKFLCFLQTSQVTALKLSICFFASLLLFSCNKDASENNSKQDCDNQSPSALIKGDWVWVSTLPLGWTRPPGHITTPDSVGYTEQVRFTDDSEYLYRNDSLLSSQFYALQFQKDFPVPGDSTLMFFSGGQSIGNASTFFFKVSCDTLILDNSYVDGAKTTYKRK